MGAIKGWMGSEIDRLAAYGAPKWAITGFVQNVRGLLQHSNIKITIVEPGGYSR
jgi:NADP-dependent 3-hydroxy acid dehydrogenase YdfG